MRKIRLFVQTKSILIVSSISIVWMRKRKFEFYVFVVVVLFSVNRTQSTDQIENNRQKIFYFFVRFRMVHVIRTIAPIQHTSHQFNIRCGSFSFLFIHSSIMYYSIFSFLHRWNWNDKTISTKEKKKTNNNSVYSRHYHDFTCISFHVFLLFFSFVACVCGNGNNTDIFFFCSLKMKNKSLLNINGKRYQTVTILVLFCCFFFFFFCLYLYREFDQSFNL